MLSLLIVFSHLTPLGAGEVPLREYKKRMRAKVAQRDATQMVAFLEEIQRARRPDLIPVVLEAVVALSQESVVAKGVEVLRSFDTSALDPVVRVRLADPRAEPLELALLMRVATDLVKSTLMTPGPARDQAEAWLLLGVQTSHRLAQRHAIEGLQLIRSKAAIPLLIEILEADGVDGSTRAFEARLALVSLTAHDFDAAEDWRKFWDGHKDTLDPRRLRHTPDGNTGVPVLKDPPDFFGTHVVSKRVVFVVDVSESMRMWDADAITEKPDAGWEQKQRLYRLKWRFAQAVHKLPSDAHFTVIAYATKVDTLSKKLVPATKSWKKKARELIYRQKGQGETNTGAALSAAFSYRGIDTILLLSDGAPSVGGRFSDELIPMIESTVQDLNSLRRVRIFTFGFEGVGQWPPGGTQQGQGPMPGALDFLGFMRRLAVKNGGTYTPIR